MLRRQARLRREYLYRKSVEEQKRTIVDKKRRLKTALEEMTPIPTDLQREAVDLQKQMKYDDEVRSERGGSGGTGGGWGGRKEREKTEQRGGASFKQGGES